MCKAIIIVKYLYKYSQGSISVTKMGSIVLSNSMILLGVRL